MLNTLILKSPSSLAAGVTNPILKRDELLNAGSLFLFDALRLGCWNPAVDSVANDKAVGNLVTEAPSALLKVPSAGDIVFDATAKGFKLKTSTGYGRIQLDTGTQYFQANLGDDYLIVMHVTYPGSDASSTTGFLLTKSTTSSFSGVAPWLAWRFQAGSALYGALDNQAATPPMGSGTVPGGLVQIGMAKVGTKFHYILNGVSISSYDLRATPWAANSNPMNWGNGSTGTQYAVPGLVLHRIYAERLTLSGRTMADVAADDYALNVARFVP